MTDTPGEHVMSVSAFFTTRGRCSRPPLAWGLILSALLSSSALAAPEWQSIVVPGTWEQSGLPGTAEYDGHAWYRTWVLPDPECFGKHDRDLYRESVGIIVRGLADAHEVFINGQKIGTGGTMPPDFVSGRELNLRHKVPVGLLKPDAWNEVVFHVFNQRDDGGFTAEPPMMVTYFKECRMAGPWDFRLGDATPAFGGPQPDKPATSAFNLFRQATTGLGEAATIGGPRLAPAESAGKLTAADDFVIEQILHEPLVAQPTHFNFDSRGRLWVANYRQYPYPAGVTVLSRDQYYRSVFDKTPPAPPLHDTGRDSVTIHEDTDGDGRYDTHRVFISGLNMVTSAAPGRGGVWVLNPPFLLFYVDADGDDLPDGDPVVHLEGFGLEDTHATANSLTWGPDGWLYGGQGSTTSSHVTRPGIDDTTVVSVAGPMVWRYHPESRHYEIFAEGGGNLWGLEFDALGRLFSGTNAGGTRGYHYMQGSHCGAAAHNPGKYGPPRHPYAFGAIPPMRSANPIPRFSHLAAVAEGTAIPAEYTGDFFCIDPLHGKVINAQRVPRGCSFETVDRLDAVTTADEAFRPVFIANAADGSLFVADFYDYYIAHGQHYQNQIDNTTGRVYRLRGRASPLENDLRLADKSTTDLIGLLAHPNKWHRRMALQILGERRDPASLPTLRQQLSQPGQTGLEALWALHQIAGLDETLAHSGLNHPFAPVREWTVRLLGDAGRLPKSLAPELVSLATVDPDVCVRAQLACTARRLPAEQSLPIVAALMRRDEDASDPCIPLLIWWALEEQIGSAADAVIDLLADRGTWDEPIVNDTLLPRIMQRLAATGRQTDLLSCARLLTMAPTRQHAARLLSGFSAAYRGRAMTGLPDELLAAMAASGASPLLLRLRQGDAAAAAEAITRITTPDHDAAERLTLIRTLGELKSTSALPLLRELTRGDDPDVARAAFAALAHYDNTNLATQAVADLPRLADSVRDSALAFLVSRGASARALLHAVEHGDITPSLIPAVIADRLRLHQDEVVQAKARQLLPPVDGSASEALEKKIDSILSVIARGNGDAYEGERIFTATCAGCHRLFHKGGNVGPDLTPYQRDKLKTMLLSIVHPNAEIREGYEYQVAITADGRSIGGFVVERDTGLVVMRGLDGEDVVLTADEIDELSPVGRSLMPDGLLDNLTDTQVRDLFAFLTRSQPISR
jgi:putative membrane-bound dehydrogenase-like protein